MLTLKLKQTTLKEEDHYNIEVTLMEQGQTTQEATAQLHFKLTDQDREDLRWYLEDYLQYPLEPNPKIADRVEERLVTIGKELFQALFTKDDDTRDLWTLLRRDLNQARIEIATAPDGAASIPWELMRDPKTDMALALHARTFVRTYSRAAIRPKLPQTGEGRIRILLVICRPGGGDDVPFRSVAGHLIKGLDQASREAFDLQVLRPPSFDQLSRHLLQAAREERPYHVVHFDGHGAFGDFSGKNDGPADTNQLTYGTARPGNHGYLSFENARLKTNSELVDGPTLGKLMVDAGVPVLVLNACRSAHAEDPGDPQEHQHPETDVHEHVHEQVRALGSLAQEVMDAGVAGVVAMRYNVYVVTAAQFVAEVYGALCQGGPLGESVTLARKHLKTQPLRTIAYDPVPLQDWCVPVVYEAAPIHLFPRGAHKLQPTIISGGEQQEPDQVLLDPKLPRPPDVGFYGRDETLLALDRAFDQYPIVLLHAFAGSGKTTAAVEFVRWYAMTGGVPGAVIFTSFERHQPLARVLDTMERIFAPMLEQNGIEWLALEDEQRRHMALQILKQVPVLWVWDNVEPIAGFPKGQTSQWSSEEQAELVDFLRDLGDTRAKVLLTSRRREESWLGDLPRRIAIPGMRMLERAELTKALAHKKGRHMHDIKDWRPLLRFTQGNPLTITVLVGQALREGLRTRQEIETFVGKLRAGQARFKDEQSEGRAKSLGASLGYGLEFAFSEGERKVLALLHFFQGFVNVGTLQIMGNPEDDWCLAEVRGLSRETGIDLLDRAAEVGLLTALGDGYYTIHPALPWYFKSSFDNCYPPDTEETAPRANPRAATRAFVEAMGGLGNYYHDQYEDGNRGVIGALTAEEANLLHARQLARRFGWWHRVTSTMQGLRKLYDHTGRRREWAHLVEEIVPDFVDPANEGPLPGREERWSLVTEYRVGLAQEKRRWEEAEKLQKVCVTWNQKRAASALEVEPDQLDNSGKHQLRNYRVSLSQLGHIQRELGKAECVPAFRKSLELDEKLGNQTDMAVSAYNLGRVYVELEASRDLDQAEFWFQRSLDLRSEEDRLGRAKSLGQLGDVANERFEEARDKNDPPEVLLGHIQKAESFYLKGLGLFPKDAVDDLAATHNQLGVIYKNAGAMDRALFHFRESIRYEEAQGNTYGAGLTRMNVAMALLQTGRLPDARDYAHAALRNFQSFGNRAQDLIQAAEGLIKRIENQIAEQNT